MSTQSATRISVTGGEAADRIRVAAFLREGSLSTVESYDTLNEAVASSPSAVVFIDPGARPGSHAQVASDVQGIPVVRLSTSDIARQSSPTSEVTISKLPSILAEIVVRKQLGVESSNDHASRAMREGQRLISIGRLTAEIAHEINNPLESVGNLLYLALNEAGVPPLATDYLRTAERELERIVQISKRTLSFSRESAQPIAIKLTDLMDEVVSLYGRRISQKKLLLIREYASDEAVLAMPGEIRQVLSNLVTNAIEASTAGGKLRLRIRAIRQFHRGAQVRGIRISIADTGSGIPHAIQARLGEMFFTTKGETGTGLGLWVTNAIVLRYGGNMRLRSRTGDRHGTTFSIFLPMTTPPPIRTFEDKGDSSKNVASKVTEISRHPRHATNTQVGADVPLEPRRRDANGNW